EGMDQMDAKLIGLSQLPDGFDREVVTNQIMYGISMIFGYTPDEFWPVQYGALGRARETEIHHMRAVTKGGSDFTLGIQDRLQRELPDTVLFEFDKRDSETDILEAEVYQAWAKVAESLYGNNIPQFVERPEQRLLTREEVRSLLASKGIINADMTEVVEDTVANAQGTIRNRTRQRSLQEE